MGKTMVDRRDVLEYAVDMISHGLGELVKINEKLEKYTVACLDSLDIRQDARLADMLRSAVDWRLKLAEVVEGTLPFIKGGSDDDLLRDLATLAEFYVYAGSKADLRVAAKYDSIVIIDGLRESIDKLQSSFMRLLNLIEREG